MYELGTQVMYAIVIPPVLPLAAPLWNSACRFIENPILAVVDSNWKLPPWKERENNELNVWQSRWLYCWINEKYISIKRGWRNNSFVWRGIVIYNHLPQKGCGGIRKKRLRNRKLFAAERSEGDEKRKKIVEYKNTRIYHWN